MNGCNCQNQGMTYNIHLTDECGCDYTGTVTLYEGTGHRRNGSCGCGGNTCIRDYRCNGTAWTSCGCKTQTCGCGNTVGTTNNFGCC